MIEQYPSRLLANAVEAISSLPGVGSRSALRLALHLLRQPRENVHHFTEAINALADDIRYCPECMMLCDGEKCEICADNTREHSIICVVESVRDVMSIEATGQYRGVYHVLGGIISPINGIGPGDLTIRQLTDRLSAMTGTAGQGGNGAPESNVAPGQIEVILALSGDVEGETTSFYIYRQIEKFGVKVTTLARGLGFGDNLEYADSLTLGRSIAARQPFKAE
ncbi:MAG: recombination protein RecR [Bacteroidales bacterium]|nr:recombination protein RecR [Bacteroidales bacterium]